MSADPMKVALLQSRLSRTRVSSVLGMGLLIAFFACGVGWLYQLIVATQSAKASAESRADQLAFDLKQTKNRFDEQLGVLQFRLTNQELEDAGLVAEVANLRDKLDQVDTEKPVPEFTAVPKFDGPDHPVPQPTIIMPEPESSNVFNPFAVAPTDEWKATARVIRRRPPAPPMPELAEIQEPFYGAFPTGAPVAPPPAPDRSPFIENFYIVESRTFGPPAPPMPEDVAMAPSLWKAVTRNRPPAPPMPEWTGVKLFVPSFEQARRP